MGVFRRICILVFSLAGICTLAALGLAWVGPWQAEAKALILDNDLYFQALEVLFCITAAGLLADLLRAIFTRNRKTVLVSKDGGDEVSISRDAISSQATHVIEENGRYVAKRVSVKAKKRGHVRVYARVQPVETVDVTAAGEELHERLGRGLEKVCGEKVDAVHLEFVDPQEFVPEGGASALPQGQPETEPLASVSVGPAADDEEPAEPPAEEAPDTSGGITVPIRHPQHDQIAYVPPEPEAAPAAEAEPEAATAAEFEPVEQGEAEPAASEDGGQETADEEEGE